MASIWQVIFGCLADCERKIGRRNFSRMKKGILQRHSLRFSLVTRLRGIVRKLLSRVRVLLAKFVQEFFAPLKCFGATSWNLVCLAYNLKRLHIVGAKLRAA
jgi:hypothetical protein